MYFLSEARLHRFHFLVQASLHGVDVLADLSLEAEHQSGETHADREHGSEQREPRDGGAERDRPRATPIASMAPSNVSSSGDQPWLRAAISPVVEDVMRYSTTNLGVNQAGARDVPVPSSSTLSRSTSLIAGPA